MKTEIHKIAKHSHSVVDMADDTVAKIIPKAGRFAGKADIFSDENGLLFCYPDGTTISLANL